MSCGGSRPSSTSATEPARPCRARLRHEREGARRSARWLRLRWLAAGAAALAWLICRSGTKPSRLAYPCQQAAASTASLAFGASLAGLPGVRHLHRAPAVPRAGWIGLAALGAAALAGAWSWSARPRAVFVPSPRADYRATVFRVDHRGQVPDGDRYPAVDDLIETMGAHGLKLHRSPVASLTAGPDGILGPHDVVIVKFNYQWPERGGTSTDVLRALVRWILDHPDDFTGEVVLCENTQFAASSAFDRANNNAHDITQSPRDVALHFQAAGHRVSTYDWTAIRTTSVGEYSEGDPADGYVVYPYDSSLQGRISYPKFETEYGTRISLRDGVWDAATGYDRERLRFLNVPVLKSHHATYGATASVKHYMGVVTGELGTNSHGAIHYGLLGALQGVIRPPDLNVLDATWINANPNDGPWTSYAGALRRDTLVAGTDGVALDLWAVKNVLVPGFLESGYAPPWPSPSADPDLASSAFRQYLDNSMARILAAGHDATNDLAQIDLVQTVPPGEASDPRGGGAPFTLAESGDGYLLAWSAPVRGGRVDEYHLYGLALAALGSGLPQCVDQLGSGTSASVGALPDDHAFVVVARNDAGDGSQGRDGDGHERPAPEPIEVCP